MSVTLAVLCSGQGRQDRGMFDMFADRPAAAPVMAAAAALLGQDVQSLLRTVDDAVLYANRTSQLLCVARGLAAAACLPPIQRMVVAGYSVGEMTAWGVAGLWSCERTLSLTAIRAEAMDAAGGTEDGLGFVRGLPRDRVTTLMERFDCAVAIVNPGLRFVFGGTRRQVERCCDAALEAGAAAARPISVHVASHTPRLSAAVAPFRAALDASLPQRPSTGRTLIGAADACVVTGARAVPGLAAQIDTTIDWAAVIEALIERGVRRVLELGPGTALSDIARTADPLLDVRSVDDFRGPEGIAAWIGRGRSEHG